MPIYIPPQCTCNIMFLLSLYVSVVSFAVLYCIFFCPTWRINVFNMGLDALVFTRCLLLSGSDPAIHGQAGTAAGQQEYDHGVRVGHAHFDPVASSQIKSAKNGMSTDGRQSLTGTGMGMRTWEIAGIIVMKIHKYWSVQMATIRALLPNQQRQITNENTSTWHIHS